MSETKKAPTKAKEMTKRAKAKLERLTKIADFIRKVPASARRIASQFKLTRVSAYNYIADIRKAGYKVTKEDKREGKRGPVSRVFTCVKA